MRFSRWFKENIQELTTEYLFTQHQIDLSDCKVHLPQQQYKSLQMWAFEERYIKTQ